MDNSEWRYGVDQGLHLFEEHGSVERDGDRNIFQIKEIDLNNVEEIKQAIALLWEFYLVVNGEDTSNPYSVVGDDETVFEMTQAEALFWNHVKNKSTVKLAYKDNNPCGIMVYENTFPGLLMVVHVLYTMPETIKMGVGKQLAASVETQQIIFRCRKDRIPHVFFESISRQEISVIAQNDKFIVFNMKWEK